MTVADVHGDVAGTQVVELDVVISVDERQVLGVRALPVAGAAQHVGGRLSQGTLVGDGDFQESFSH